MRLTAETGRKAIAFSFDRACCRLELPGDSEQFAKIKRAEGAVMCGVLEGLAEYDPVAGVATAHVVDGVVDVLE